MADGTRGGSTDAALPLIATDDAGAAGAVQIVKLALSADGSAVPLTADADGMLVNLGANNDVTVTGSVAVTNAGLTELAAAIDTELQVDVVGALPAGTNAIGKLAANTGVDIGDVDVTSVIPGTGATSLGKAIDSIVGATDTGVLMLAKHTDEDIFLTSAEGDYDVLHVDSRGALHASPEQHIAFDSFDVTTGWSALSNDTLNLATTTKHINGTAALTFDKVNGAANTIFAGIQKTLTSINLGDTAAHDLLQGAFYIPTLTDVAYVFLRLGTDSTNYNEWRLADTDLTAATFLTGSQTIGDANYAGITGNGWNTAAITYIAVGVAFDAETNTLAGIVFDEVSYHTNLHTSASINAEVSSSVTTPNVNINRVGGVATDTNTGTVSAGSLRVTLATNVALPAGTNAIGKLASNSGIDIGDVDVLTVPADPFGVNADAGSATGSISAKLRFIAATGIPVTNTVTVASHAVTNAGTFATQVDGAALTALQLIDDPVFADDAAFTVGTSKVMAAGYQSVAHGSAPDAADALDAVIGIANRDRVQFVIGGHPNVFTYSMSITTAVTNAIIGSTNAGGTKPVVTGITAVLDNASTVFPTFIIGFGTASTPAMATTPGTAQILASHPGIPAGGGMSRGDGSGILGVGVDGDEIRITTTGTAGGNGLYVTVTGYLVPS